MRDNALAMHPRYNNAGAAIVLGDPDSVDVNAIVNFAQRSWRLCVIWLGVGLCASIALLIILPSYYTAESTLIFYSNTPRAATAGGDPDTIASAFVDTQIQVLQSAEVLGRVVDKLDRSQDQQFNGAAPPLERTAKHAAISRMARALSVRRVGTSDTIAVAFTARDQAQAATVANAIIQAYFGWRTDVMRSDNAEAIAEHRAPSERSSTHIKILTAAEPPINRSSPNLKLMIGIGILASAAAGIGHAFLRQAMDRSLKTPEDVQRLTGLDWVGSVPIEGGILAGDDRLVQRHSTTPSSHFAHARAMVGLMARLHRRLGPRRRRFVIGVAAPTSEVETSPVAACIAESLAQNGRKTLLIDANWQELSSELVLPSSNPTSMAANTLAGVYLGQGELDVLVMRARTPISPLTASASIVAALRELREKYECVVVNFHANDRTADMEASMAVVDRLVAVVESGRSTPESLLSFLGTVPEDKIEGILVTKQPHRPANLRDEFVHFVKPVIGVWRKAAISLPEQRENLSSGLTRASQTLGPSVKSGISAFDVAYANLRSFWCTGMATISGTIVRYSSRFKIRFCRLILRRGKPLRPADSQTADHPRETA
jgi:succinoglycan biosynthesis transport protein ExoP